MTVKFRMYEKDFCKIRDLAEGKLRGLCAGLSPEKRVITIVVLAVLFAVGNFYMIFRAIHGHRTGGCKTGDYQDRAFEHSGLCSGRHALGQEIREMEEFFNQFNK